MAFRDAPLLFHWHVKGPLFSACSLTYTCFSSIRMFNEYIEHLTNHQIIGGGTRHFQFIGFASGYIVHMVQMSRSKNITGTDTAQSRILSILSGIAISILPCCSITGTITICTRLRTIRPTGSGWNLKFLRSSKRVIWASSILLGVDQYLIARG